MIPDSYIVIHIRYVPVLYRENKRAKEVIITVVDVSRRIVPLGGLWRYGRARGIIQCTTPRICYEAKKLRKNKMVRLDICTAHITISLLRVLVYSGLLNTPSASDL